LLAKASGLVLVDLCWPCTSSVRQPARLRATSWLCRDLAGGLLGSIIDLANFQAAPIALQGLEADVNMLQARPRLRCCLRHLCRELDKAHAFAAVLSTESVLKLAPRVLLALRRVSPRAGQ
jgi:hypothetical protein